jgi:hypothetical protein
LLGSIDVWNEKSSETSKRVKNTDKKIEKKLNANIKKLLHVEKREWDCRLSQKRRDSEMNDFHGLFSQIYVGK